MQQTYPITTLNLYIGIIIDNIDYGIILYVSDLVILTHAYMMSSNYAIIERNVTAEVYSKATRSTGTPQRYTVL